MNRFDLRLRAIQRLEKRFNPCQCNFESLGSLWDYFVLNSLNYDANKSFVSNLQSWSAIARFS